MAPMMLHGYVMKGDQHSVGRRTIDDLDRSTRGEEEGNWGRLMPKGDGQCEQIPVGRDCRGRSVRPSVRKQMSSCIDPVDIKKWDKDGEGTYHKCLRSGSWSRPSVVGELPV